MKGRPQFRRRFSLQPAFKSESRSETPEPAAAVAAAASGCGGIHVRHKVVVLGAARVGKSALIERFLNGTFNPKYRRTVEQMHHVELPANSPGAPRLSLDILDTSGAFEFPAMRALSIASADAFILVYDVTDLTSFEAVTTLREEIRTTKADRQVPIVVVGNKTDLIGECERQVDNETTESVVTVDWEHGFIESSAKEDTNVTQIFKELLNQAKVRYNLSPAMRKRRRQSLPRHSISEGPSGAASASTAVPTAAQLQHLEQLRERHAGDKRNSCIIS